ncbi:MAG TPA: hypothetical protein VFK24_02505 [Gammaproteobacteria bacterium]|nr:hypothetical protein [Gammaproteobacteria bacterium]
MDDEVGDPLKPLEMVLEPDIRSTWLQVDDPNDGIRPMTLQDHHAAVAGIRLSDDVPLPVRQLMETAKNLVLYSWFCYRFHQPAELVAFGALEMALRQKAEHADAIWYEKTSRNGKPPPLGILLAKARREKWIRNQGFEEWRRAQQFRAWEKEVWRLTREMEEKGVQQIAIPDQSEFSGAIGDGDLDYVGVLEKSIPYQRNSLAHGSSTLHPNSLNTLNMCVQAMDQLFP